MQAQSLTSQFETLLPLAAQWATEQQARILREGVPLSIWELAAALKVGVQDPDRVRLLQVEIIPSPTHPLLQAAYQMANFVPSAPRGLTLHYGIFVRADYWRDRSLIVHELVHTAQYERLGGIQSFLGRYLLQCSTVGYHKSALEIEAVETATRLLKTESLVRC